VNVGPDLRAGGFKARTLLSEGIIERSDHSPNYGLSWNRVRVIAKNSCRLLIEDIRDTQEKMTKSRLAIVTSTTVNRTVKPLRRPNAELRTREHLTAAEVEALIEAARATVMVTGMRR
jgi:hypothetical protein